MVDYIIINGVLIVARGTNVKLPKNSRGRIGESS